MEKGLHAPPEDGAPSASLDHLETQAALTHPRVPPKHLGSSPWPQELASGRPRVEDFPLSTTRHGNLPLHYLCKRCFLSEPQLELVLKCYADGAKAPNKYGKLPMHFLARNPSLTRHMLTVLVEAYPGAMTARDQAGSLPLHYVAQNKSLSKEILQAFLAACGEEGSKEAAAAADKYGNVPLRHLVASGAMTDQHLRVMLRANDRAVQVRPSASTTAPTPPHTPFRQRRRGPSPCRCATGTATRRSTTSRGTSR